MINEESMKHWADEFNEIQEAKDARIADLEKQLAERDAALARCVEALKALYDETADYIRLNHLGDIHQNQSMRMARHALVTIQNIRQSQDDTVLSNLILTGPDGERLVISSDIEPQTDGSFRFTVTSPISSRRFGVVCGITELQTAVSSLPASAQATAKVLAAARQLAESWKRYDLVEKDGLVDASRDMDAAEIALYEAIREEQAYRSSDNS